jgi:hypothetical protein
VAKRVQSRYTRHLHDLPSSERAVHLLVEVRRFFCQKKTCQRKIFAERFPFLVYWLLGTSVCKIAIFAFFSSLFAWRMKLERGKGQTYSSHYSREKDSNRQETQALLGDNTCEVKNSNIIF